MQLRITLSNYHILMSESKHLSAGHEVCKHREFITISILNVIFVKRLLDTISGGKQWQATPKNLPRVIPVT